MGGVLTVVTAKEIMASPVQPAGEQWLVKALPAHDGGIVGFSWAPSSSAATLATGPAVSRAATHAPMRLATAGIDGAICIWHLDPKTQTWTRQHTLRDEQTQAFPAACSCPALKTAIFPAGYRTWTDSLGS